LKIVGYEKNEVSVLPSEGRVIPALCVRKHSIESGDYGNDSEYFRDLIRRDQARRAVGSERRRLLEKAEAGGFSDRTAIMTR